MTQEARPIRALLVDDHALFRESVALALAGDPNIRIAHCGGIREALQAIAREPVDIVLLDHDLGNERASQFLPAAREAGFDGKVLIVTAWVSEPEARRLFRQGVSGIFLKHSPLNQLVDNVRAALAGELRQDASMAHVREAARETPGSGAPVFDEKQRKVMRFVLEGLSNKEIAWRLQISESYVKAILQTLFQKTGVRTRGQLVRVAFEQYQDWI